MSATSQQIEEAIKRNKAGKIERIKERRGMLDILRSAEGDNWKVRALCDLIDCIMDKQPALQQQRARVFPVGFTPDEIERNTHVISQSGSPANIRANEYHRELIGIAQAFRNSKFVAQPKHLLGLPDWLTCDEVLIRRDEIRHSGDVHLERAKAYYELLNQVAIAFKGRPLPTEEEAPPPPPDGIPRTEVEAYAHVIASWSAKETHCSANNYKDCGFCLLYRNEFGRCGNCPMAKFAEDDMSDGCIVWLKKYAKLRGGYKRDVFLAWLEENRPQVDVLDPDVLLREAKKISKSGDQTFIRAKAYYELIDKTACALRKAKPQPQFVVYEGTRDVVGDMPAVVDEVNKKIVTTYHYAGRESADEVCARLNAEA